MYSYSQAGAVLKKRLRVARGSSLDLDAVYTYDNEGRMTATQYPSSWNGSSWVSGPNLGNTFDSMGRLQTLTELGTSSAIISGTTYNPAGQLLTMTGANGAPSETRTYNSIGQMEQLQSGGLNIQYNYSATVNNGKITSQTDVVSGEQITYTYDSLNRLATATSSVNPGWGQSYGYDGFGNLTTQIVTKGTAPSLSVSYDPATNRQTGECADANGNLCGNGNTYDVENRLVRNSGYLAWAYSYAPGNKRVWRGEWTHDSNFNYTQTTDEVTYWSVSGQKLATYQLGTYGTNLVATQTGTNYYFGGKLLKNSTGYVTPDRLGSIGKYFPYGQERPSATTDGKEKFATYFRDSESGLDYAQMRYHQPGMGRFLTPDPYLGSADIRDPGSWNRYAYAEGDPVNSGDPSGLCDVVIAGITETSTDNVEGEFPTSIGAMTAFPYAGSDKVTGVLGVAAQAITSTAATQTAVNAILAAAADSDGPINIFAFSGGAAAFKDALGLLPASVISRIQNVTYASPGVVGELATVNGQAPTVIVGTGAADIGARIGTIYPLGTQQIQTNCGHNAACEFAAGNAANRAGNPCAHPTSFSAFDMGAVQRMTNALSGLSSFVAAGYCAAYGAGCLPNPGIPGVTSLEWLALYLSQPGGYAVSSTITYNIPKP
jgi:RHS repeat-associated protein